MYFLYLFLLLTCISTPLWSEGIRSYFNFLMFIQTNCLWLHGIYCRESFMRWWDQCVFFSICVECFVDTYQAIDLWLYNFNGSLFFSCDQSIDESRVLKWATCYYCFGVYLWLYIFCFIKLGISVIGAYVFRTTFLMDCSFISRNNSLSLFVSSD